MARRLAHLVPPRPPGTGGTPPLALEVRRNAIGAVILDGLSYRRAGRAVGISKTAVGDSLDLLLSPLAALGFCQPDGSFLTSINLLGASPDRPRQAMAEVDPDQAAALRRLRAAFGFVEILRIVDHDRQDQDDKPIEEGKQAPPADR